MIKLLNGNLKKVAALSKYILKSMLFQLVTIILGLSDIFVIRLA